MYTNLYIYISSLTLVIGSLINQQRAGKTEMCLLLEGEMGSLQNTCESMWTGVLARCVGCG